MPSKSVSRNVIVHWKFFNQYFADAANFTYAAYKLEAKTGWDQFQRKRDARAGILYCTLALESVANCCLDVLQLQKGTFAEFDKLPTLGKFEVFLLYVNPKGMLDRENALVRPVRNLISCRNSYVHSKVLLEETLQGSVAGNIWQPLGLPFNSSYWQPLHAVKAFTVLSDFLNYFFFKVCGYPYEGLQGRSLVTQILSSGIAAPQGDNLPGDVPFSSVRENAWIISNDIERELDLEFAFLGIHTSTGDKQIYPKRKWGDYSHCKVEELEIPSQHFAYHIPKGFGVLTVGGKEKQKHMKGK